MMRPSLESAPLLFPSPRRSSSVGVSRGTSLCSRLACSFICVLLILVGPSSQQKDPVQNFCRRFGHQTAVIDRKLYIDGGLINWNPIPQYPANYTNTWLLYQDLDDISPEGMPQLYANLSKNSSIPDVSGGILWADDVNKRFYLFGGEYYQEPPTVFTMLSYDVLNDQWDSFGVPQQTTISGVSYGAGVAISERGLGYYYGGWMSNNSVPQWSGPPVATSSLVKYDMDSNSWTNNTGPDSVRRAEGSMNYIPAGDGGMLIYLGGVTDPYANGTVGAQPMDEILVYDVLSSKWYKQGTTGATPQARRRFCSGATWPEDQSSYNIYLYGGEGFGQNLSGYDDVYILTMPTFTWIKMYPNDGNVTGPYKHHSLTCNVVDSAQMVIVGGTFPTSDQCDAEAQWGTHNLDMGEAARKGQPWQLFSPNLTRYSVPDEIVAVVGGSAGGGAAETAPAAGFDDHDLSVLMTRRASMAAARTPTRAIPAATGTPDRGGALGTGAIAGVAVGAGVALLAAVAGVCCWARRHRRSRYKPPPGATPPSAGADLAPPWSPLPSQSSRYTPPSPYPPSPYVRRPSGAQQQQPPAELPATGTSLWTPGGSTVCEPGAAPASPASPPQPQPQPPPPAPYSDQPKPDGQGRPWCPQVSVVQGRPGPLGRGGEQEGRPRGRAGYSPVAAGSPPPQELSSDPRLGAGRAGGSTGDGSGAGRPAGGLRHQTYYHP